MGVTVIIHVHVCHIVGHSAFTTCVPNIQCNVIYVHVRIDI